MHTSMSTALLENSKHVLVEKPLATLVADADLLIAAAEKNNCVLMAGQCRRFFDGAQVAKERVAQLGCPLSVVHFREFVGAVREDRSPQAYATEVRPPVVTGMEAAHRSRQTSEPVDLDHDSATSRERSAT
jgi:hypothetical protein